MTRPMPTRAWLGLLIVIVSESATLAGIQPFFSWNTPIAWTGYILFVDGWVWKRRGTSWLHEAPGEFLFLALVSIPLWVIFELYNKYSIHNWHYIGLPEFLPLRYFGYAWAFATISPAIFETGELVSSLRGRPAPGFPASDPAPVPMSAAGWVSVAAGASMVIVPAVVPSPYLAAPLFLGFAFLLDPLNARAGAESITGDLRRARYDRLVNLLIAGLVCGFLWELWNYRAATKWVYTVPILEDWKIFEMPVPGYGGFPPFAVECFALYVTVRHRLWRGAARPVSI
jgi:hypothetical protein